MNTHQRVYIVRCFCVITFRTCVLSTERSITTWNSFLVTNDSTESGSL